MEDAQPTDWLAGPPPLKHIADELWAGLTGDAFWKSVASEIASLAPFDLVDLLTRIGGLQLVPANAHFVLRLHMMAHALASVGQQGDASISATRFRRFAEGGVIARGIAQFEDPPTNPFTLAVSFFGGSHLVVSGPFGGVGLLMQEFARAIGLTPQPYVNGVFQEKAVRLFRAALSVSDEMAHRVGLRRNQESQFAASLVIPGGDALRWLQRSVHFREEQLRAVVNTADLSLEDLEPLVVTAGDLPLRQYHPEQEPLLGRPIVRLGESWIVANPSGLMPGAMLAILELARQHGAREELADFFAGAVWDRVLGALDLCTMGRAPLALPEWEARPAPGHEAVFGIDTDKAIHVMCLTDPLDVEVAAPRVRVPINLQARSEVIRDRIDAVARHVLAQHPRLNEVGCLIVLQTCLTDAWVDFEQPKWMKGSLCMGMSADELDTIAHLCQGNPLILRQFAGALERLRERTELGTTSTLNTFAFYRKRDESFYDDHRVDYLAIGPDHEVESRLEVLRKRDWHGVPSPIGGTIDVARRWDDAAIPVYFAPSMMPQAVNLLVKAHGLSIWLVGAERGTEDEPADAAIFDMLAFWLWQVTPYLASGISEACGFREQLVMEVRTPDPERWNEPLQSQYPPVDECVKVTAGKRPGWLCIVMQPEVRNHLARFDNAGECALMRAILTGVRAAATQCEGLDGARIDQALSIVAPLGPKKMFHAVPLVNFAAFEDASPISRRLLQPAEQNAVLDDVGEYLRVRGITAGEVPGHQRVTLLNDIVGCLYDEFRAGVASLSAERLLETLVGINERLTVDGSFSQITLINQLACFSDTESLSKQFGDEAALNAQTGISLRWLIEYVTVRPPRGLRPFSLSVFDRMLALISKMIYFGFESDYLHYGVTDSVVTVLPSGRIGIASPARTARDVFVTDRALGMIRRQQRAWPQYAMRATQIKEAHEEDNATQVPRDLEEAFTAEFGLALGDAEAVVDAVRSQWEVKTGAVRVVRESDMVSKLIDVLGWGAERVNQVLAFLTLAPRRDFMEIPAPFAEKPYPWRLGRMMSYARRPLLKRLVGGNAEVVWGLSHSARAMALIRDTCESGTLHARTELMRRYVGERQRKAGSAFERDVAALLRRDGDLVVKERVRKIGARRAKDAAGRDLGDIDVLVAHPKRQLLFVLECKDLGVARTPVELANELTTLFRDRPGHESTRTKHLRRSAWVTEHLFEVLAWLGLQYNKKWRVVPAVVTSLELMGPLIERAELRVVSVTQLEHEGVLSLWKRKLRPDR